MSWNPLPQPGSLWCAQVPEMTRGRSQPVGGVQSRSLVTPASATCTVPRGGGGTKRGGLGVLFVQ